MHRALVAIAALALAGLVGLTGSAHAASGLGPAWREVSAGPDGGSVWQGRIPNGFVPWDRRSSAVYLPPGYDPSLRYPVIYLLHGMSGAPSSIWDSLHLARVADRLIAEQGAQPFIAVMPVAGPVVNPNGGEWAGVWESYLVSNVVPWVDAHLPTLADRRDRALEGLCAGGFGAADIGLRHPDLFGTLGSWEGYFAPVFHDGPFVDASQADLAGHDPTLLVRNDANLLRSEGTRFYVSVGGNHGDVLRSYSLDFARELRTLGLPNELWLLPRSEHGRFWSATLPSALAYADAGFATPAA